MATKSKGYSSQKYYQRKIDKLNEEREELVGQMDTLDQAVEENQLGVELVHTFDLTEKDREIAEENAEKAEIDQYNNLKAIQDIEEKIEKLYDKMHKA